MDTPTQKPFACKAEGCGMSFTNEDHLNVHEKKHEMSLNLGLENKGSNVFVADQTPTPTRLIKNCEEVGLFDDLKHVNPFDETFRRAVESKGNSDQSVDMPLESATLSGNPLLSGEESLHTPQVFPTVVESRDEFKIEKQSVILSDNITFKVNRETSVEEKKEDAEPLAKKRKLSRQRSRKVAEKKTGTKQSQPESSPTPSLPLILPNTISVIQPQVITLGFPAAAVAPSKRILLPKPASTPSETNSSQSVPVKERLKAVLNGPRSTSSDKRQVVEQNDEKKSPKENTKHVYDEDCMERRRAAAMRYRKKIKKEQIDLKRRNAELTAENSELKAMIKHLKQVLMAHQNCDISRTNPLGTSIQLNDRTAIPIQIQPATFKLVMNLPKLVLQPAGKIPINSLNMTTNNEK